MPFRCARGLWSRNEEPSIGEVLSDPVVRTMMARDGVDEAEVRRLLTKWSERETSERALRGAAVLRFEESSLDVGTVVPRVRHATSFATSARQSQRGAAWISVRARK